MRSRGPAFLPPFLRFLAPRPGSWLACLLILGCLNPALHGAAVSQQQALSCATGWLSATASVTGTAQRKITGMKAYAGADGHALFYVASLAHSGYLVVSADDEVEPIIAFSYRENFTDSQSHPLYAFVHDDMSVRLENLRAPGGQQSIRSISDRTGHRQQWARFVATAARAETAGGKAETLRALDVPSTLSGVSDLRVSPLIQTQWDQGALRDGNGSIAIYNYFTPPNISGSVDNYPAGCVATSWAQVMYFHQWPTTELGTSLYSIKVDGVSSQRTLLGGDGAGGPYQWSDIPLQPLYGTTTQIKAVGALLYDVGVANNMEYTKSSSSAYLTSTAIRSVFHYANALSTSSTANMEDKLLAIRTSLDAGLPVIVNLQQASGYGGHAPICDGYGYDFNTLYHHINLGWNGFDDAWYNLPNVAPGNTSYVYQTLYGCVYNIDPQVTGEIISGRITDVNGLPRAGVTIKACGPKTHTTTSNAHGIFAFKGLASNTQYVLIRDAGADLAGPTQVIATTKKGVDRQSLGNVVVDDFQAVMKTRSLQVTILPKEAVDAGAHWGLEFSDLNPSGATLSVTGYPTQRVGFSYAKGWLPPLAQTLVLQDDQTTRLTVTYLPAPTVSTLPSSTGDDSYVFNASKAMCVDQKGNLYIADGNAIRKRSTEGVVSVIAGSIYVSGSKDGIGSDALFYQPCGICCDGEGNVFIADTVNNTIRKMTPAGEVTTYAGTVAFSYQGGSADGSRLEASFHYPRGLAVDAHGILYVADCENYTIRKITPDGMVSTLAGVPGQCGSEDGLGTAARFTNPRHLATTSEGTLWVIDGCAIRKVSPEGLVSTVAGSVSIDGFKDGKGAAARFSYPTGIVADPSGNLYVADSGNEGVRLITPAGIVTTQTVYGTTSSDDGLGFGSLESIAIDSAGALYVVDSYYKNIRKIVPPRLIPPVVNATPAEQGGFSNRGTQLVVSSDQTPPWGYFQWQRSVDGGTTWNALEDGGIFSGTATPALSIARLGLDMTGQLYRCVVSNGNGTTLSQSTRLAVTATTSVLTNISSRAFVGTDDSCLIAGFVLSGTQPKRVLIRATGPTLNTTFGMSGVLLDPALTLYQGQTALATNVGWGKADNPSDIKAAAASLGAFAWPDGSNDSAMLVTLPPGAYTAKVSGNGDNTGIALIEVYDADLDNPTRLSNISTRSLVKTGDGMQIAGFVIAGNQSKKVLLRASGPILGTAFGVLGVLADPTLEIIQGATPLDGNTWWSSSLHADLISNAALGLGAFYWPPESHDSALFIELQPGVYSGTVYSKSNCTGVGLIEMYDADSL